MTNAIPLTPDQQAALAVLPATWQHYFVLVMAIIAALTTLGRILVPLLSNQGIVSSLKAAFLGSAHAQSTVTPSAPPTPTAPGTAPK